MGMGILATLSKTSSQILRQEFWGWRRAERYRLIIELGLGLDVVGDLVVRLWEESWGSWPELHEQGSKWYLATTSSSTLL